MTHCTSQLLVLTLVLVATGCTSSQRTPVQRSEVPVRADLAVLDGRTGDVFDWTELMAQIGDADVVVLGELHNDAVGHAVQLAVVEDMLDQNEGSGGVALEMLERDEQLLIEDYRDGLIDAETFAKLTRSTSWSGEGSWDAWYQPVIDAAIERDAAVIAANAPRRYVRLARTDGWDRFNDLDITRRSLVETPDTPMTGQYRDRFIELMGGGEDPCSEDLDEEAKAEAAEALETAEAFFRSQQVWDATMASSVSEALRKSGPPVMLLIGRFHSDSDGGTTQHIKRLHPAAKVVTISLEPSRDEVEFDETLPQADFIICTTPEVN